MNGALVSIITPVYEGSRFLAETMRTVAMQTFTGWEHIIVDDGSSDGSAEVAEACGAGGRTRIIRHETNRGIAAARNTGLEAARGRYVAMLDQDDLWTSFKLEEQVRLLESFGEGPQPGLCFGRHAFFSLQGGKALVSPARYPVHGRGTGVLEGKTLTASLFEENFIGAGSVVARRDLLRDSGGFDESLTGGGDDYDLWLRLAGVTSFAMLDRTVLLSRVHSENFTDTIRMTDDVLEILGSRLDMPGVTGEAAKRRFGSIRYKRFIAFLVSGDLSRARGELGEASGSAAGRAKMAAARFLTSMGPAGAWAFLRLKRCFGASRASGIQPSMSLSPGEFDEVLRGLRGI